MSLAAFLHTWWLNAEEHQASYQQQDAHEFYLSALFGLGNSALSASLLPARDPQYRHPHLCEGLRQHLRSGCTTSVIVHYLALHQLMLVAFQVHAKPTLSGRDPIAKRPHLATVCILPVLSDMGMLDGACILRGTRVLTSHPQMPSC